MNDDQNVIKIFTNGYKKIMSFQICISFRILPWGLHRLLLNEKWKEQIQIEKHQNITH